MSYATELHRTLLRMEYFTCLAFVSNQPGRTHTDVLVYSLVVRAVSMVTWRRTSTEWWIRWPKQKRRKKEQFMRWRGMFHAGWKATLHWRKRSVWLFVVGLLDWAGRKHWNVYPECFEHGSLLEFKFEKSSTVPLKEKKKKTGCCGLLTNTCLHLGSHRCGKNGFQKRQRVHIADLCLAETIRASLGLEMVYVRRSSTGHLQQVTHTAICNRRGGENSNN